VLIAAAALAAGAVATGGMLVAQGSSSSSGRTGIRLTGTFTLFTSAQPQAKPCAPHVGYTDIANGAPVVIRDQRGVTVGSGSLSSGSAEPSKRGCAFQFAIRSLPVASSYTVTVGQRGGLPYSYADLKNAGWKVTMGLGALPPG
jgi:hypothetical protein